jgi:hypothetical protein
MEHLLKLIVGQPDLDRRLGLGARTRLGALSAVNATIADG